MFESIETVENPTGVRFVQTATSMTGMLFHVMRTREGAALLVDGRIFRGKDGNTATTNSARAKARAEGKNDVDAAYAALRDPRAAQMYNVYWSLHTIALETP